MKIKRKLQVRKIIHSWFTHDHSLMSQLKVESDTFHQVSITYMLENKWYDVNVHEMFCMRKQKTKK